jgi:hypothetical protein
MNDPSRRNEEEARTWDPHESRPHLSHCCSYPIDSFISILHNFHSIITHSHTSLPRNATQQQVPPHVIHHLLLPFLSFFFFPNTPFSHQLITKLLSLSLSLKFAYHLPTLFLSLHRNTRFPIKHSNLT